MFLTPEDRRWNACIHETGHAAAALLLGIPSIGAVVFDDSDGCGGIATPEDVSTATSPPEAYYEPDAMDSRHGGASWPNLLRDATYYAAGCAAFDLVRRPEVFHTFVIGSDAQMIYSAARAAIPTACAGPVEMAFARMAAARARCLLEPFLLGITLAAQELDRRGRMTCEQIVEAMYPEHANKQPKKETQDAKV
jgi:hypothetical protein